LPAIEEGGRRKKRKNLFLLFGLFALAFLGRPFTVINLMVVPTACRPIGRAFVVKKRKECFLRYGQKEKRMLLFVCFYGLTSC
jgi:small ligand-binding sensory domain FIST